MATILVVDDDDQVRDIVKGFLQEMGHSAIEAADGLQALSLLAENSVDLVISDIFMPHKEGLTTIAEIRAKYPEIKVLVMSGGGGAESGILILELGKQFGAESGLHKPFQFEEFKSKVEGLLRA